MPHGAIHLTGDKGLLGSALLLAVDQDPRSGVVVVSPEASAGVLAS